MCALGIWTAGSASKFLADSTADVSFTAAAARTLQAGSVLYRRKKYMFYYDIPGDQQHYYVGVPVPLNIATHMVAIKNKRGDVDSNGLRSVLDGLYQFKQDQVSGLQCVIGWEEDEDYNFVPITIEAAHARLVKVFSGNAIVQFVDLVRWKKRG